MLHICFDVDDVLNNLMESWLQNHNYLNKTNFQYKDIIENPPHKILEISKKEYLQSLYNYRNEYYGLLSPNLQIIEFFNDYGDKAHFSVLTSAFRNSVPLTSKWVFGHFGDWIRTFAFVPSKVTGDEQHIYYDKKKADWLIRNNVNIYIDDNIKKCNEAISKGIPTYCVKQPWSWNVGMELGEILNQLKEKLNAD